MQLLPRPKKDHSQPTNLEPSPHDLSLELSSTTAQRPQSFQDRFSYESTTDNFHVDTINQRVVILIDGSNLFYAASYLNIEIDYVKLLRCLVSDRRLVRAYFYTGVDRSNEKQQGFLHWMRRNGYRVVAKDLIQFPDGSKKANVEVEIAVDMMLLADCCDTIVLLSGDGNLAYAANVIAYRGVQVEIVSLRSMTSDSLINVADRYTDLDSIKHSVQRL
ncbi:MAG: NYN domain-containing protein [Oscillatoriales cyanobacterium C42_A2020_001]|nr:NYN domain-containing protein [Leptolyngbyaceae cyanobacterium C42_A2020_001]